MKFRKSLLSARYCCTACVKIAIRKRCSGVRSVADFNFDIWRLQAQGDLHGLMTLLRHPNPDMRRRAATALRAMGAAGAIPALQTALVTEGDADVRAILV